MEREGEIETTNTLEAEASRFALIPFYSFIQICSVYYPIVYRHFKKEKYRYQPKVYMETASPTTLQNPVLNGPEMSRNLYTSTSLG